MAKLKIGSPVFVKIYFLSYSITIVILSCITFVKGGTRSKLGEACDSFTRCDSLASLTCQNGSCNCLKPDSMIFDQRRQSCVSLAGEKCKFIVVEEYRSWLEEVNCVINSHCTSTGLCVCDSGFIELSNGSCVPKKIYGETCNETSDCRSDLYLQCIDEECKCDPEVSIYSYAQSSCVGLADKPCLNDLCTDNAICRGYYGGHSINSYEEYSGEQDTKCTCPPGFTRTLGGLCQVGHGSSCDFSDMKCLEKFVCKNGNCSCKYPGHQVFEEIYQDCYSLVGGPCTNPKNAPNSSSVYCIKPAICLPQGNFRHSCVCPEGMVENGERGCELTHGRICQAGLEQRGLRCDELAPLFCINGRCQCEDELQMFDPLLKKCRGLVGANCMKSDINDGFCVDGAFCKPFRGSPNGEGICECIKTFVETVNGTCNRLTKDVLF